MRNRNQNVELSSRRPNAQLPRPPPVRNSEQHQQYYQLTHPEPEPQPDPEPEPQASSEASQLITSLEDLPDSTDSYTFSAKFRRDKALNTAILLMLVLYLFELYAICGGLYHLIYRGDYGRDLRRHKSPLQLMSADLKADPIMDIQILNKGSKCPQGFEIHKLGLWPGTRAGCLCEDGKIHGLPCHKMKDEKCKKDLPLTIPIEMFEWEKSIWCVKRAVEETDYVKKIECPEGYKECYVGGCFKGECPITSLEITSTGAANKFNNDGQENKYLTSKRTKGELPLINIQMSLGNIPCFTQDLFEQSLKNFSYYLAHGNRFCDRYGLDGNFSTKIDTQVALDSFIQNSFPYELMHLPYFKGNASNTTSILSSKTRMKTAKHDYCLDIDENSINDHVNSTSSTWSFVCCIFLLIIRLIAFIILCCCFASGTSRELFDNAKDVIFNLFILNIVMFAGTIFMLLAFREVYGTFEILKGYFERYILLDCFAGGQGSMVIDDALGVLKDIESGFWVYWWLLGVSIGCFVIHISLCVVGKISKRRNRLD